jgi:hypothetical protein
MCYSNSNIIATWYNNCFVYAMYARRLSVQAQYSRLCLNISSSGCYGRLVTWKVVGLTAAKFKSLIFSVSGFTLSNNVNICIFIILNDFCLSSA